MPLHIFICASTEKKSSGKREFIFIPWSGSAPKEEHKSDTICKNLLFSQMWLEKYLHEKYTKKNST